MVQRVLREENSRTALTLYPTTATPKKLPQYVAAVLATLGAFTAGSLMSWTSSALPLLQLPDSVPNITGEQGSWIASLLNLGAFFGALPSGVLADYVGRKRCMVLLSIPLIASWLLIAFSTTVYEIYAGRFLAGMAVGAISVTTPMYIAEISESGVRGALGTFFQLQITLGILFGYLAGLVGNRETLSLMSSAVPVLFLVTFVWMPESPVFLLRKNRKDEAKRALQWFRGPEYDTEDELRKMKDSIQEEQESQVDVQRILSSRGTVLALVIAFGLMIFQQLSGINAVIFYTGNIFDSAGSSLSPVMASVLVGGVQVLATYVSTLLVDQAGRRILLLVSDSVMAICLGVLGLYFHLQRHHDVSAYSWVPLLSLALFIVVFSLGFGPIPWIMIGELFPANIKGVASAMVAAANWILAFTVTKVFQNMLDYWGSDYTFWFFAGICGVGTIFVAFLVPETKGKSLEEIEAELNGRRRQTSSDMT